MRGHFLVQKYLQGPGALSNCGKFLPGNIGKILLLADNTVMPLVFDRFKNGVSGAKVEIIMWNFEGECSEEEISKANEFSLENGIHAIAGAGGGKSIDTARLVGNLLKIPFITIPTIAATNAATNSAAVVYSKDHIYKYPVFIGRCPELVIVDTEIIVNAPVRFLVAGMGGCAFHYI
jgi:glycerol dehydrogenase